MPDALQSAVDKAEIDYADLPEEIKTWIIEHPYQTTFYIVNGIVFFYPNLISGPVLWSLGWTSNWSESWSSTSPSPYPFMVLENKKSLKC